VQFIDVRDLAAWTVRAIETGLTGPYNATGYAPPITFEQLFDTCRTVSASDARLVWVPEQWLLASGAQPWTELPLWVPENEYTGFHRTNMDKAVRSGLTFRPLADTVRDTLAWAADARLPDHSWRAGLSPERERELLAAWQEQSD
jgi:2'-hydroxyisoflavone reductase